VTCLDPGGHPCAPGCSPASQRRRRRPGAGSLSARSPIPRSISPGRSPARRYSIARYAFSPAARPCCSWPGGMSAAAGPVHIALHPDLLSEGMYAARGQRLADRPPRTRHLHRSDARCHQALRRGPRTEARATEGSQAPGPVHCLPIQTTTAISPPNCFGGATSHSEVTRRGWPGRWLRAPDEAPNHAPSARPRVEHRAPAGAGVAGERRLALRWLIACGTGGSVMKGVGT
jgi:hypothetical protein